MLGATSLVYNACFASCFVSFVSSAVSIVLQLKNYRKPMEQRLIVRILVVVPLFAVSCYCVMGAYKVGGVLEPIREMYEAFVIYMFYKLLVQMLGGERHIIQQTVGKQPTGHPFPMSLVLSKVHISDPLEFLMIKRLILQYVWMKPVIYVGILVTSALGVYDVDRISSHSAFVWLGIAYNVSVTLSLYNLAMFWKCLYEELRPFKPWKKFLCVKLIIFASYWQGLLVGMMNWLGAFDNGMEDGDLDNRIQNGLLCLEMVFFAWMHWTSFPYTDYTPDTLRDCARVKTWVAFKDSFSFHDLLYDIKMTTINGDSYNLRNYDAKTDSNVYVDSQTFNKKIYQGLRMSSDGRKYWINGVTNDVTDTSSLGSGTPRKASHKTPLLGTSQGTNYVSREEYYDRRESLDLHSDTASNISSNSSKAVGNENLNLHDQLEGFERDEKLYSYVKHRFPPEDEINYPVVYEYQLFNHSNRIESLRRSVQGQASQV